MASETAHSRFDGGARTVFYSNIAGFLITTKRSNTSAHMNDIQTGATIERHPAHADGSATGSEADHILPTFSAEERSRRVRTLSSHGIIVFDEVCPPPSTETSLPLECLESQPPDFALFEKFRIDSEAAPQRLSYMQLMVMVAFDWWDMLLDQIDGLNESLAQCPYPPLSRGEESICWVHAVGLACSRGHGKTLRCLLEFFLPLIEDIGGIRCQPRSLRIKYYRTHLLEALAWEGLERPIGDRNSKLKFSPRIMVQLRRHLVGTKLLTEKRSGRRLPLAMALINGDATLSELLINWMGPSSVSKLVHPDSAISLLHAACRGNLPSLAKYLVEAGADVTVGAYPWVRRETNLRAVCGARGGSEEDAVSLVRYLHELGDDLFPREGNFQTPLHYATSTGKLSTVRYILAHACGQQQRHPKDSLGKSPLMLAESREVMQEFAPWRHKAISDEAKRACDSYLAITTSWHDGKSRVDHQSVSQLLYEEDDRGFFKKQSEGDLRWIHLPANNVEWCEDLLLRWYLEGDGNCEIHNLDAARHAFSQQHVSRTLPGRFMRPGVYCTQLSDPVIFIAAPYIDFETSSNLEQIQEALRVLIPRDPEAPLPMLMEKDPILTYIDSPGFHPRRTLDQYVYYNMDTSERDTDQVVQRYQRAQAQRPKAATTGNAHSETEKTCSQSSEQEFDESAIMIDQLWIWILGNKFIVTCCAQRWDAFGIEDHEIARRFEDTIPEHIEPHRTTAGDLAVRFMTACFGDFDRHTHGLPQLQFMSMFEQSLGVIGAQDSSLLKRFSSAYKALRSNKETKSGQLYQKIEFVKSLNDLTLETDLLTELKDIRDELHIMNTIFIDQQRVVRSLLGLQTKMVRNCRASLFSSVEVESARIEDQEEVFEPVNTVIDQSTQIIAQLDSQASRLSNSLSELLQLKQAHYNAFELEFSRDLALDAARQGRAVLVFTIVTIVFSPLSFVAAFFTMNLTIFPDKLSLSYVCGYVFGFGFVIAVPCIVLALSVSWWAKAWEHFRGVLHNAAPYITSERGALEKDENVEATSPTNDLVGADRGRFSERVGLPVGKGDVRSQHLGEVRSYDRHNLTAGPRRRWRRWRKAEATDLPR